MDDARRAYIHKMVQGNLEPSVRRQLLSKETDDPISFEGASATFIMSDLNGNVVVEDSAVFESPATGGYVRYDWSDGDTDNYGTFAARFHIVFASGKPYSMPNDSHISVVIAKKLN